MEWRKSSFCARDQPMCVEVSDAGDKIWLKDSEGDLVSYSYDEFDAFLKGVKAGEFDF